METADKVSSHQPPPRRRAGRGLASRYVRTALGIAGVVAAIAAVLPAVGQAATQPLVTHSKLRGTDGVVYTATNHLVGQAEVASQRVVGNAGEYLVVWAGDVNAGDNSAAGLVHEAERPAINPIKDAEITSKDAAPGSDFLAVIDANPKSSEYGKVVNTVTVGPVVENEPHHLQYVWHKGHKIYAGGLFSDITYVFDVEKLPEVTLSGVNLPQDTPCGSVPDAYWVLNDGTAYGTYMGGPDLPGPCRYTNGETRVGNGFGGTPGSLVRIGPDGKTRAEVPAAIEKAEDAERCPALPEIPVASCANPHGIQLREDLNRMITTDYAEPKNVPTDPLKPANANLFRDTVRIWNIKDRNNPRVVSVSAMPDGPRRERNPGHEEPRGIMEGTVTNQRRHKGAFASSMCGGVIYYTPDIRKSKPKWREVFDDTAAAKKVRRGLTEGAGCDGGGWVQTSANDKYLYHAVIGRNVGDLDKADPGVPKMVYTLDIRKLLAAGNNTKCNINTIKEVYRGGRERDCPTVVDVHELPDSTSGGPHWGALDNFRQIKRPGKPAIWRERAFERRMAVSNYFVARSGVDGNHKVCMLNISRRGRLRMDNRFIDEFQGTPCVNFNRTEWPHGDVGAAKPHSQLFVVRHDRLK